MTLWVKAGLRGVVPFVILAGIAAILAVQNETADARSTLAAAGIAAFVSAASVIYEIDSWSLKRQSAVHFAAMAVTVLPILILSGWFPTGAMGDYVVVGGSFLVVGIAVWTIAYLVFGHVVPRLRPRGR